MSSRKLSVQWQRGLSLVELLVALAISMIIVIAAATFFLTSGRSRDTQEAASLLQDNARFATDLITRNIQQAGYQNYIWDSAGAGFRREVAPPVRWASRILEATTTARRVPTPIMAFMTAPRIGWPEAIRWLPGFRAAV
jgi:Tfp pilus assembly protein PilW